MADKSPQPPQQTTLLTSEARQQATKILERFEKNLKLIAEQIAHNNSAENVLVPHINEALLTLKRSGLQPQSRKPFYWRPDFYVGVGTFLVGLSPTLVSVAKDVITSLGDIKDQPVKMWLFMIIVPVIFLVVGCFVTGCGWVHHDTKDEIAI